MNSLKNTDVIYQVFTRDFSSEGTLNEVTNKLEYIKSLGVTMIQLLPVNPIGEVDRLGTYGSPYSISHYMKINPDLGTVEDFKNLCTKAHEIGLKVILDVVFNHTSKDSILLTQHPDFYLRDENGNVKAKFPEWSDIIDLNHDNPNVEKYLTSVLKFYAELGVDGYRFDVASIIRKEFFTHSKEEVRKLNKDIIYIAEAVDSAFINLMRMQGYKAYSNEELFEAGIDACYHYASWEPLNKFLHTKDEKYLEQYKGALLVETNSINSDGMILRAIENHDQDRIASYSHAESFIRSVLVLTFFTKGAAFVYNGEECKDNIKPNLFEKETINFNINDYAYFDFFKKNTLLKNRDINNHLRTSNVLNSSSKSLVIDNSYDNNYHEVAVLNFAENFNDIHCEKLDDGHYRDILTDNHFEVKNHTINIDNPVILVKE